MNWIKKILKPKKSTQYHVQYEKSDATRLFDELEELAIKKQKLRKYVDQLENKKSQVALYEQLGEEDIKNLALWVGQYKGIMEQKHLLKGRLIKNNRALYHLAQYEEELPELMKEMSLTERFVKENERDMIYLEEEKEDLMEEREVLLQGYRFLKGFIVVFVLVLSTLLLGGFGLLQLLREGIWVYLSVVSIALVLFLAGILYAKEYLERELRKNELLQKKVVKYLNKAKIRYFHHKRYLDFQFEKLGVDSHAKLEMYYNRYIKNKDNEQQYNAFNRQLMTIESRMGELFESYDIMYDEMGAIEEWLQAPKKAQAAQKIVEQGEQLMQQIGGIEALEEELWREVYALKEMPKYTALIEDRIQKYLILTKNEVHQEVS